MDAYTRSHRGFLTKDTQSYQLHENHFPQLPEPQPESFISIGGLRIGRKSSTPATVTASVLNFFDKER